MVLKFCLRKNQLSYWLKVRSADLKFGFRNKLAEIEHSFNLCPHIQFTTALLDSLSRSAVVN